MDSARRFLIGKWMFVAAVLGAVLAIGSLDRRVMCVVALVISVAVALVLSASESFRRRRCASLLVYVAAALLAFTILQAVPLPASVVRALSPHAADVWSRCLRPLGESGPAWHPLTLDPPATHLEILRGATYLVALLGALAIARERDGARFLVRALIVGGVVLAMGSITHAALGLDKVYGFVRPKTVVASIGPLLNSNHAGGYVNIALMLAASSALSKTPSMTRVPAVIVTFALVGFEIWNASRGAVGTMALGLVALVALHQLRRRHASRALSTLVPALVALGGVAMIVLSGFESSAHGLSDTSLSKLRIGLRAIRMMVPAYAGFGAGRGAFEATFPEYMNFPREGFIVFTNPENVIAQWVCEWGPFVAVAAMVALAIALRPRNAMARGDVAIGAWVALAVVGLQNLVDFSMEVPGVMLALVVCAAIVTSGAARREEDDMPNAASRFAPAVVLVGVSIVVVGIFCERGQVLVDAKPAVRAAASDVGLSRAAFIELERGMSLDHPAEPYFAFAGASRALREKEDILPWIERTLERAPIYAPAHLVLARWLRRRSRSQSRLEYRIAAEQRSAPSARELAPLIDTFDDALEAVPSGKDGAEALDGVAAILDATHPATRVRIDAEIERRDPTRVSPLVRRARDGVIDARATDATPWCAPSQCVQIAIGYAKELEARAPNSSEGFVFAAQVAVGGDAAAALNRLRDACATVADRAACLRELAELDVSVHGAKTDDDIEAVARQGCPAGADCVDNILFAATLEERRQSSRRALVFLRRAAEMDPNRSDLQERVALQASADGLHAEAAALFERLAHAHPDVARYTERANAERTLSNAPVIEP